MTLAALLALCQKATPGPWRAFGRGVEFGHKFSELLAMVNIAMPVDDAHATANMIAACSPEVIAALVRVAMAAQKYTDMPNAPTQENCEDALRALSAALAQERG